MCRSIRGVLPSGNVVDRISEVTLHRARLVLRWVTVRRYTVSVCNQPPRPTQPPALSGTGSEYRPECRDAVRLGSKGRYDSFHL